MKIAHLEAELKAKEAKSLGMKVSANGFFSKRWILVGFVCVVVSNLGHVVVLPFADMTLFTTTCSIAILISAFLSIKLLGEPYICKYDVTASILICTGSALTILQMNTTVQTDYDRDMVADLLLSNRSLFLLVFVILLFVVALCSYFR